MSDTPPSSASLRSAASALVQAADMLDQNDAIFKGPWKKGSKGWSAEFIDRTIADGLALLERAPRSESEALFPLLWHINDHLTINGGAA